MITSNVFLLTAVTSLLQTDMKDIIPLGNNRYIHLDLGEKYRLPITKLLVPTLVLTIAAITAGAMVGIDITNIQPMPTQQQTK